VLFRSIADSCAIDQSAAEPCVEISRASVGFALSMRAASVAAAAFAAFDFNSAI
jgi:hypothetical protein